MTDQLDIMVTWPQTKPLDSYLADLRQATEDDLTINYRVARLPKWPANAFDYGANYPRCYMAHSGFIRGWCRVLYTCYRAAGEVEGWPAGFYIVRDPEFHAARNRVFMPGFRGWRWFDRKRVRT